MAAVMNHMVVNFSKLDKFEGVDFRRWKKKMHFFLSTISVVYVLNTPIPGDGDDATLEQIRRRNKWENDDYVCCGIILSGMYDSLFDIYPNVESRKELWDCLKAKYMAEDVSDKKFLGSYIIDKLYPSWKDFKHTLKHKKEELILVGLGSHLRIEESLRVQDSDNPKGNNVASPLVVNMVEHNNSIRLNIVNDSIGSTFMSTFKLNDSILWHAKLGHVHFKRMQDMSEHGLIPTFDMDTENDLCDLHATSSLGNKKYFVTFINDAFRFCYVYLLHAKDEALDKFKVFKTKVELQQGSLIKRFRIDRGGDYMDTVYFQSVGSGGRRAVVRLPDPMMKNLGKRCIECIFVGYAEHSKAFRFYVIEPNESVSINSIIESRFAIFDENRFSSVPRPSQKSLINGTEDIGGLVVLEKVTEEKEEINDEMDSIMGNNTRVLANLPLGYKPLAYKWFFKRKVKVDETIEKFKARLVSQGYRQKSRIDYFDTYAPVARISTKRRLITLASIHNLIIHQMDVKTSFLNGELDEEFDDVVLSNGYLLNQADKCVYSKFDESGKGVIIYLYVDDMLIFGTNQVQVDLTKELLSSRFFMKDMGEADVILGIRIKHESNGITISQSYYIEKVLKKFNYFDCTLVSTPMDTSEKLMPNNGHVVSQFEYSRVIGCLMYAMTCTRPYIDFSLGKLSRYTSNLNTHHWQAIQRASKKQTCITSLTMESEFVALAAAGKESEWLRNLILEIPLWSKPIEPIFIRCDSADTLVKSSGQMYNEKSRHLGVRHSMIHELITNGVVSIEFVRSQRNLADHLTKGLARDLVLKSSEGMCLKSNLVTAC
ncbi:zinc finger, CCHC-type containing protein [Tanacetum coccineum]